MFRIIIATVLFSAALALGAPGAALADQQSEFEAMCRAAGLEVVNGKCVYEDGSELSCAWQGDAWMCYRSEPKPSLGLFGRLTHIPKVIVTKPVHPGPVISDKGSLKLKIGAATPKLSDAVTAPSEKSVKRLEAPAAKMDTITVAPSPKLNFSAKTTTLKLRKN